MKNFVSLDSVNVGKRCNIVKLLSKENEYRRLLDLGFIKGSNIDVLAKSPFGDPTAYYIRGTVIALRNEDAKKIIVLPCI